MSHKEVLQNWFDEVWTSNNTDMIYKMFPADGKAQGLGAHALEGPEMFHEFHKALSGLLTDITISIDKSFEKDEWFSALCTLEATQKGTDNKVSCTGHCFCRIANEQIKDCADHWEFMYLFEQMGLLPKDSFATALAGEPVI